MLTFRYTINADDIEKVRNISASAPNFDEDCVDITAHLADDALYQAEHPEDEDYPHDTNFLFAELDGVTCAYACYGEIADSDGTYELYWLATHSKYQGQGIGKKLIGTLVEHIKSLGGRKLYLKTDSKPEYKATRNFYNSCGFTLEATLKQYYDRHDDCCIYGMCLDDCDLESLSLNAAE